MEPGRQQFHGLRHRRHSVGLYSADNLANLGIGQGAADAGVGYTYFNPHDGNELTA
jgi:hypothetical protein